MSSIVKFTCQSSIYRRVRPRYGYVSSIHSDVSGVNTLISTTCKTAFGGIVERIIAIFNQAGGTGKTTVTQNLAYCLKEKGGRVLTIDLDPQGSLTAFAGLEPLDQEATIGQLLLCKENIDPDKVPIVSLDYGVDLIPSNITDSRGEIELSSMPYKEYRLKRVLEPIFDRYDFCLIDCPPALGNLSWIALATATDILIPIETQYKATKGTDGLLATIREARQGNTRLNVLGFLPFRYDGRRGLDKRSLSIIKEELSSIAPVFEAVPTSTAMAECAEKHMPLDLLSPGNDATKVLRDIATLLLGGKGEIRAAV